MPLRPTPKNRTRKGRTPKSHTLKSRTLKKSIAGAIANDALVLAAIGVVVLLVSLPRLSDFVVRANEGDARSTLLVLGKAVFAAEHGAPADGVAEIVAASTSLEHQLCDGRPHAAGRVFEHHGYLFERVLDETGTPVLRAWPRESGRTGRAAFTYDSIRGLRQHPNANDTWSGLEAPPDALLEAAWSKTRAGE